MARNEEKNLARLNRFILQQQREEHAKKHPRRPKLNSLSSAAQVRNWLPSIVDDISFNLKQSQVSCYPHSKIEEHRSAVDRLRKEHTAYIHKLRSLDSDCKTSHWADRPYKRLHWRQHHLKSQDEHVIVQQGESSSSSEPTESGEAPVSSVACVVDRSLDAVPSASEITKVTDVSERISLPVLDAPSAVTRSPEHCSWGKYQSNSDVAHEPLADAPLVFNSDWLRARHLSTTTHPLGITYDVSDCSEDESNSRSPTH